VVMGSRAHSGHRKACHRNLGRRSRTNLPQAGFLRPVGANMSVFTLTIVSQSILRNNPFPKDLPVSSGQGYPGMNRHESYSTTG
jgi:hypothetical protein